MYWYIAFVIASIDISATCRIVLMLGTHCVSLCVGESEQHLSNIPFHLVRPNVWAAKSVPWGTQHNGGIYGEKGGEGEKLAKFRQQSDSERESIIILMARG